MKIDLPKMKQDIKDLAARIRKNRIAFKQSQRDGCTNLGLLMAIKSLKFTYRHKHIAYSLARGRTMEQIEKPLEKNMPNMREVEKCQKEYSIPEETIESKEAII